MSIGTGPRGGLYIDGFNLYHAIDDLAEPYLKWLDLRRLARLIARGHAANIDRIVFGTAYFPSDFDKRKRHERYVQALESVGVDVLFGHTTKEPEGCLRCGHRWDAPREKETDINVALSAYADAIAGKIDVVFLLSADTDQAATLRFLRDNCPLVRRIVVTPPGRYKSKHLLDLSSNTNIQLTRNHLDECLFRQMFHTDNGKLIVAPKEYAPPLGWVHPDDRP